MMGDGGDELLHRNIECFAHTQEREDGDGTTGFHHLPVADTEAVRDHVLLAKFSRGSASPYFVTEAPKKSSVMLR